MAVKNPSLGLSMLQAGQLVIDVRTILAAPACVGLRGVVDDRGLDT